jgi:hypothetical protein
MWDIYVQGISLYGVFCHRPYSDARVGGRVNTINESTGIAD